MPAAYWLMDNVGMAVLRLLDPERAHDLAIWALKNELVPQVREGREGALVGSWHTHPHMPCRLSHRFTNHH